MLDPTVRDRLDALERALPGSDVGTRWREWLENAGDEQLRRIHAYELADAWGKAGRDVLTELIHATRFGLVVLNWDVVCPACKTAHPHEHLGSIRSDQTCAACGSKFEAILDQSIAVTFSVHPGVRMLAEPPAGSLGRASEHPVTGLDCATLPAFREFFDCEVLSEQESLRVTDVTVMFTDVRGSTGMYARLGDARAYNAVRSHFEALFRTVAEHDGAVVKTIGDAVMAGFTRPEQGVRAALAAQETFRSFQPLLPNSAESIVVKIGVHRGPCLAVTLNGSLDYFGGAINIAARTQQQSGGGEICITHAVQSDPQVRALLAKCDRTVSTSRASLRGLSESIVLYTVADKDYAGATGRASSARQLGDRLRDGIRRFLSGKTVQRHEAKRPRSSAHE